MKNFNLAILPPMNSIKKIATKDKSSLIFPRILPTEVIFDYIICSAPETKRFFEVLRKNSVTKYKIS